MDRILIRDLQVRCIVGLRDEERREKQDVTINLALFADLAQACHSDRLEDSFDYSALKKRILAMVEGSSFFLIEAMAEAIAQLCLAEPKVLRVRVQVEKPSALRFARSVGVRITRQRTQPRPRPDAAVQEQQREPEWEIQGGQSKHPQVRAFVAVGSNIEPAHYVREAIRRLADCERVTAVSTVYQSPAVGPSKQSGVHSEQPPFYNCVVEIATSTAPADLKHRVLRRIEAELGRQRSADKYAARTIDLDLIAYGDLATADADLALPDPQIAERAFLAVPLSELAPDLVLPGTGQTAHELAQALSPSPLEPLHAYTQQLREHLKRGA